MKTVKEFKLGYAFEAKYPNQFVRVESDEYSTVRPIRTDAFGYEHNVVHIEDGAVVEFEPVFKVEEREIEEGWLFKTKRTIKLFNGYEGYKIYCPICKKEFYLSVDEAEQYRAEYYREQVQE